MADSISKILADIASSIKEGGNLNNVLDDLAKKQKEAFDTAGAQELEIQLKKLEKQVKATDKAQEDYNEALKEAEELKKKDIKAYEKQLKIVDRLGKVYKKTKAIVKKSLEEEAKLQNDARQALIEKNEIIKEHWKQNTRMGAAYKAVSGPLAKVTAGFLAGTMAMKAFNKWLDAGRLKQDLMIKSYRDMETNEPWTDTASKILDTEKALRTASANAILFGQDVNQVSGYLLQFQKMTGKDNPQALEKMYSATAGVARVIGVDMSVAMAHVKDRIDKFGGSTSSAIMSMMALKERAADINNAFGDTVIRVDDVISSVNSITSANNIYAVDQDFVTKAITRNMTTLQSQGESYDFAKDKAMDYMKAVTTEAPEFMKIKAGQALKNEMQQALSADETGEAFMEQYGDALEKAKPGLAEKVKKIAMDPNMAPFSKTMLIQEMTSGTKFGMEKMNDMILEFANNSGGVEMIAKMYNTNRSGALAIIDQAKATKAVTEDIAKIKGADYETAKGLLGVGENGLQISKEQFEFMKKQEGGAQKLYELGEKSRQAGEKKAKDAKAAATANTAIYEQQREMLKLEKERAKQKDPKSEYAKMLDKQIEEHGKKMADNADKMNEKDLKKFKEKHEGSLDNLDKAAEKARKMLENSNAMTGKTIMATLEEYSGILQTATGAVALFAFGKYFNNTLNKFLARLEKIMMKASGMGGDGGYGGDGGGPGRKKGKFKRSKMSKMGRRFSTLRKGLGKSKLGRLAGGAMNLASRFGGTAMDLIGGAGGGLSKVGGGAMKAVKGLGGGAIKGLAKGAGKLLGPLSGILDFGMNMMSGEGLGRSAIKAIGSTVGGALGGIGGSLVAPGVGTVAGGVAGAAGGDILGGMIADWFGFEDPEALAKGTNKDVVSQMTDSKSTAGTSGPAGAGGGFSGVMRPKGQIFGDKINLELDGGLLMQLMGGMNNSASQP